LKIFLVRDSIPTTAIQILRQISTLIFYPSSLRF